MARPERFELPTAWFVARYSIQLSYGRILCGLGIIQKSRGVSFGYGGEGGMTRSFGPRPFGAAGKPAFFAAFAACRTNRLIISGSNPAKKLILIWRRGRDSNPRWGLTHTPLAGERLQPLGHLSGKHILTVFTAHYHRLP